MRIPNRNRKIHFSPLRYPGGKTFLYPYFEKIIKDKNLKNVTYVEPYAGGAGAALALLMQNKVKNVVINDFDYAIYSFWKSAIFHSKKFIERLNEIPITIKEWRRQRKIYDDPKSSQFDKGFATFYLNRTNRSGVIEGGPIGGIKQKGNYKINARFNKVALSEKIKELAKFKDKISVFNRDGIELINDYLGKKNTFIFIDPPYYDKGSTLYLNYYQEENHMLLAKKLNRNLKSNWLLTYDKKKEIKALYYQRKMVNFSLNYNVYESRKGKELMIFSEALKPRKSKSKKSN